MLLKQGDDGKYSNMWLGEQPELALFHCALQAPIGFSVSYRDRARGRNLDALNISQVLHLEVPFEPDVSTLEKIHINLHKTLDFPAYIMPEHFSAWFGERLGYKVVLVYLGDEKGIVKDDDTSAAWKAVMEGNLPQSSMEALTFSDGGALLVTSEVSLRDLHRKLPDGVKVIHEKFRPNIIVDGEDLEAWSEDFWAEVEVVRPSLKLVLTSHCARCICINVDLEAGKMGEGESGMLFKKMMSDRRVDPGHKWYPVFGRYGFPISAGPIRVGDEIVVAKKNMEYTKWSMLYFPLAK
jgi:uncharacterized protein YcbX